MWTNLAIMCALTVYVLVKGALLWAITANID